MSYLIHSDVAILTQRLTEAEATVKAILSGEIDAVVDPRSNSPVLLALAQKALRESEARYRSIVETANEGIWMMNFDSTITFVNQRLADMLGYRPSEVVGRSFYDFIPPKGREEAGRRLKRASLGRAEESEGTILQRSGQETWVLIKSNRIHDSAGESTGMLAMITDATRHRAAERALRESEAEHRQIVESTSDGIIKIDRSSIITFVNARLAEMLGYTSAELVGTTLLSIVARSERANLLQSIMERQQDNTTTLETFYRHKLGAEIAVSIAGSSLLDGQGELVGVLGVVRDVTERKKLQAQLIVSDRMASVGTLAAGVAHEINNPLAAVIANLEFIDEGVAMLQVSGVADQDPEWFRERITDPMLDARAAAERVRFIVRDLMIFSRSPTDEPKHAVDVNAVLESSLRMGWNEVRHRAELVKHLGTVPFAVANEARLGQVFLNLIVNAAQSLPVGQVSSHEIRVSTFQAGESVVIEIGDTGSGIAPEVIERIFDAFYTTKSVGVGTGLGLAICQRIVTDMGGTLTVTSTLGVGSVFRVCIPVAVETAATPPEVQSAHFFEAGGRLLIVDDEEAVGRILRRSLDKNYDICIVDSACAALALIEAGDTFDLILCDLMMPSMTGMDLHSTLLRVAPAQAQRMMFMTGGAFTDEARQFLASSGVIHVEKPFHLEFLRATVHEFLVRAECIR
ncbi:MAG: PAS domain S-box protein [Gemmatimonas sp.]